MFSRRREYLRTLWLVWTCWYAFVLLLCICYGSVWCWGQGPKVPRSGNKTRHRHGKSINHEIRATTKRNRANNMDGKIIKSAEKRTPLWKRSNQLWSPSISRPLIVTEKGSRFVPAIFMLVVLLVRSWDLVLLFNFLFLIDTLDIIDDMSLYNRAL